MSKIKILDCSLRDGGYYNNWQFETPDVNRYLKQVYSAKIDVVEIGFHFFEVNNSYGKFAFVNEKSLNKIILNKETKLAIMFNGADLLNLKKDYKSKILSIFKHNKKKISIVRIAVHYKNLKKIKKFIDLLKSIKIKVCINLMQINTISNSQLSSCLNLLTKWNNTDVFYFADSFGNINPKNVKKICSVIKKNWAKEFGIHSHDNCGLALKNTIQAFKSGATWLDGTIQGMGRGAGNVTTENLLKYFKKYNYAPSKINQISKNYFLNLKKKYKWGASKFYKLAAQFNIHPSYIQELCKDDRYSEPEIKNIIISLSKINSKSYDPKILERSIISRSLIEGKWNANGWCKNRSVLIIGQGASLKNKINILKINDIILKEKPLVISININNHVPKEYIDCHLTCNETRMLVDHKKYNQLNKAFILPLKKLKSFTKVTKVNNFLDYGVKIENNNFKAFKNYAILPSNQSFGYALSVSIIGGTNKIFLAGFDGYSKDHNLQKEMENIIELFKKNYSYVIVNTITKSNYNISSI